ncbi:MAG: TlpA disulfide reductase family protein [Chloroflexota bacterium]
MTRARALAGAVLAALLVAGCSAGAPAGSTAPGSVAPAGLSVAYRAQDLDTQADVSVADLAGKPALLASWAVWCTDCIEELPALEAWWTAHPDALQLVAVNVDSSRIPAVRRARSDHLSMGLWHDPGNAFSRVFGLPGIPGWVLLDAQGQVVKVGVGALDPATTAFTELLASVGAS